MILSRKRYFQCFSGHFAKLEWHIKTILLPWEHICAWIDQFTWRLDKMVDGREYWSVLPNHWGWLFPCCLSQLRNAKTKRSAWVGVNVIVVYCLFTSSEPSIDFERKTFSWPWSTIMSPSYTLFEVQCSCHLGTTCYYQSFIYNLICLLPLLKLSIYYNV